MGQSYRPPGGEISRLDDERAHNPVVRGREELTSHCRDKESFRSSEQGGWRISRAEVQNFADAAVNAKAIQEFMGHATIEEPFPDMGTSCLAHATRHAS